MAPMAAASRMKMKKYIAAERLVGATRVEAGEVLSEAFSAEAGIGTSEGREQGDDEFNIQGLAEYRLDAFLHALLDELIGGVGGHQEGQQARVGLPGLAVEGECLVPRFNGDAAFGSKRAAVEDRLGDVAAD